MSQVAEHPVENSPHGASAADDGDSQGVGLDGQFGAKCRLVIAAGTEEYPKEGLDLAARESHLLGASAAILEDLPLPLRVAYAQVVLPLVGRDLRDDGHPSGGDLEKLVVEGVDHGAQEEGFIIFYKKRSLE
jgi:hypothetical protein